MQAPQTKECLAPLPKVQLNSLGSLASATGSDSHPALLAGLHMGHLHRPLGQKAVTQQSAVLRNHKSQPWALGGIHVVSHLSSLDLSHLVCKREITPLVILAVTSESLPP